MLTEQYVASVIDALMNESTEKFIKSAKLRMHESLAKSYPDGELRYLEKAMFDIREKIIAKETMGIDSEAFMKRWLVSNCPSWENVRLKTYTLSTKLTNHLIKVYIKFNHEKFELDIATDGDKLYADIIKEHILDFLEMVVEMDFLKDLYEALQPPFNHKKLLSDLKNCLEMQLDDFVDFMSTGRLKAGHSKGRWSGTPVDAYRFCNHFNISLKTFNHCISILDKKGSVRQLQLSDKSNTHPKDTSEIARIIKSYPTT